MGQLSTAAILPIRGMSELVAGCIDTLRAQHDALDEIVLVDDNPTPSIEPVAGTRVVPSFGRGPYAARNVGWRATSSDVVLFLDGRSRPRPAWSQRLAAVFDDPEVALSGSEVEVSSAASLGARAAHQQQFFRLSTYLADPFFLPYLPTCNLAVRRTDLEAVDGFGEVRSGGDADLCWRILRRPGRSLVPVEGVLMDWIPRDRTRDYLEQNYRYGRSHVRLCREWADAGATMRTPAPPLRVLARVGMAAVRMAGQRDPAARADALARSAGIAFDVGQLLELRSSS